MIKVLLVDDHQILLDGLVSFLRDDSAIEIVGQVTNARSAIEFAKENQPDLVITDIEMPEIDGIELTQELRALFPDVKILALTMYNEQAYIKDFLRAGGNGYVLKNSDKEELLKAVSSLMEEENFLSAKVLENFIGSHKRKASIYGKKLSEREIDIIQMVADELTTEEIAEKLHLSALTVKTHRKNIFLKLGVKNSAGLIKYAMKHGLIN